MRMRGTLLFLLLTPGLVSAAAARRVHPAEPSGVITTPRPSFVWSEVPQATGYVIHVDDARRGAALRRQLDASDVRCIEGVCRFDSPQELAPGHYRWRVQAVLGALRGRFGRATDFTLERAALAIDAPSLVAPSGLVDEATPRFAWKPSKSAERYVLELRSAGERVFESSFDAADICGDGGCSVPAAASKLVLGDGDYAWSVRAAGTAGEVASDALSFRVVTDPAAPGRPVLLEPRGRIEESQPRFVWRKEALATEYDLQLKSRSLDLLETYPSDQMLCPDDTCSVQPEGLVLEVGLYFARLRARNAGGDSPWSAPKIFLVTPPRLSAPTPLAPSGSAPPEPVFEWTEVPGASAYLLQVTRDATTVHRARYEAADVCSASACRLQVPGLVLEAGAYAFRLRAFGTAPWPGPWSDRLDFEVGVPTPPPATTPRAPSGLVTVAAPDFVWDHVPEATSYSLTVLDASQQVVLQQSFTSAEASCTSECVVVAPQIFENGDYRFVVTPSNGAGDGPASAPLDFTIDTNQSTPPGAPSGLAPVGPIGTSSPSFVWAAVLGATSYTLTVETASSTPVFEQVYTAAQAGCAAQCTVASAAPLLDGSYRFFVSGANAAGPGPPSLPLDFTVQTSTAAAVRVTSHLEGEAVSAGGALVSGTVDPSVTELTVALELNGQTVMSSRRVELSATDTWTVFLPPFQLVPGSARLLFETLDGQGGATTLSFTLDVQPFDPKGAMLLERATFGATPALVAELQADGVAALQDRLLHPTLDPDFEAYVATLPTGTAEEVRQYAVLHAVFNPNQLQEVLTQFWDNHFSTDMDSHDVPEWELRENALFRANAFGRFRDLLEISAKSPAMLVYLDQDESTKLEPNENYARELLELHTLSVNGSYTQNDVEELARILTGWKEENGQFFFDAADHDEGAKVLLGVSYPAGRGLEEGEEVLDRLAGHPETAQFLCSKLAELIVSEKPGPALVDGCASVFLQHHENGNPSQMREVVAYLLDSPEFSDPANFRAKVKTPLEALASTLRNFEAQVVDRRDLERELRTLGMDLFELSTPDGYSELGEDWIDTSLMLARFNFVTEIAREAAGRETWVDLPRYFRDRGYVTAEGILGYLFGISMSNEVTPTELALATGILTLGGSSAFDIDAPDAEARLQRLVGTVLSFPGYQHQ